MWTNISTKIKCPRGDCLHTKCAADEPPGSSCTCNRKANSLCRTFRYQPAFIPPAAGMPGKEKKHGKDDPA